ncbi:hypothetical protein PCL_07996 [Purpureocillium lilacinum]|uniref:Uncharacterized protein n=1 Tax=Purpureocillium lilacinum TaxID=33203 RepID=A0A2U3EJM2_PURLI|nr:hypothetical protein PCL_07996 [Purpureocillium lilacinum]
MLSESQRDESQSLAAPKRLQLAYADARFVAQPRNTVLLQELACSLRRGRALQFQMPLQSIKLIGERVHAVPSELSALHVTVSSRPDDVGELSSVVRFRSQMETKNSSAADESGPPFARPFGPGFQGPQQHFESDMLARQGPPGSYPSGLFTCKHPLNPLSMRTILFCLWNAAPSQGRRVPGNVFLDGKDGAPPRQVSRLGLLDSPRCCVLLPTFLRPTFPWCEVASPRRQGGTLPTTPVAPLWRRVPTTNAPSRKKNPAMLLQLGRDGVLARLVRSPHLAGSMAISAGFFVLQLQPQRRQQDPGRATSRSTRHLLLPHPPLAGWRRGYGTLVLDSMRPRLSCTGFLPALHQAAQRTNDMSPLTLLLGALRPPRAWHKDHGTTASNIDSPAAAKCAAASLLPQGPALVHSTARTRPASVAPTFFLASIDYVRRDA